MTAGSAQQQTRTRTALYAVGAISLLENHAALQLAVTHSHFARGILRRAGCRYILGRVALEQVD